MKQDSPTENGINWEPEVKGLHPMNCMPEPYQELTLDEFLLSMFAQQHTILQSRNYRQVDNLPDGGTGLWEVTFFNYPFKTFAVAKRYTSATYVEDAIEEKGWWGYVVNAARGKWSNGSGYVLRFFKVGCKHEFKEISHHEAREKHGINPTYGMFDHIHVCQKCGRIMRYDSSG